MARNSKLFQQQSPDLLSPIKSKRRGSRKSSENPTKGLPGYIAQISQQYIRYDELLQNFLKAFKAEIDEKLSMTALTQPVQPESHIEPGTTPSCVLTADLPNLTGLKISSKLKDTYLNPLRAITKAPLRFPDTNKPWRDAHNICRNTSNAKGEYVPTEELARKTKLQGPEGKGLKQGLGMHRERLSKAEFTPLAIKKAFQNEGKGYILDPLRKLLNNVETNMNLSSGKDKPPSELQIAVNLLKQFERGIDIFIKTGKTEEDRHEVQPDILSMG